MRRRDREISDAEEISSIIRRSMVCRLAMTDGESPYIVPMRFGFDGERLYFHSAAEGLKLEIIRRNLNVCFEFDIDVELAPSERICDIGMRYRSVIGYGTARFVTDSDEMRKWP